MCCVVLSCLSLAPAMCPSCSVASSFSSLTISLSSPAVLMCCDVLRCVVLRTGDLADASAELVARRNNESRQMSERSALLLQV